MKIIMLLLLALSFPSHTAPISNVKVKLTTGFYVNTATNIPSIMLVRYGTSPTSLTRSVSDNVYKTKHRVDITGLNFGTKYFYRILVFGRGGVKAKTKILYHVTENKK